MMSLLLRAGLLDPRGRQDALPRALLRLPQPAHHGGGRRAPGRRRLPAATCATPACTPRFSQGAARPALLPGRRPAACRWSTVPATGSPTAPSSSCVSTPATAGSSRSSCGPPGLPRIRRSRQASRTTNCTIRPPCRCRSTPTVPARDLPSALWPHRARLDGAHRDPERMRRIRALYYGLIGQVDDGIARIMATLRRAAAGGEHGGAVHRRPRRDAR